MGVTANASELQDRDLAVLAVIGAEWENQTAIFARVAGGYCYDGVRRSLGKLANEQYIEKRPARLVGALYRRIIYGHVRLAEGACAHAVPPNSNTTVCGRRVDFATSERAGEPDWNANPCGHCKGRIAGRQPVELLQNHPVSSARGPGRAFASSSVRGSKP